MGRPDAGHGGGGTAPTAGLERPARVPSAPQPAGDLDELVDLALERDGALLSAGELRVVEAIRRLPPRAKELYARLTLREGAAFRDATLPYEVADALPELFRAGLATRLVPETLAVSCFSAQELAATCARLGHSKRGARAELEARIAGSAWRREPVFMVLHRGLLRRLERLAEMDRASLPAERRGFLRWARYAPTGGPGDFRDRRALLRYERSRSGLWEPGEALRVAQQAPPPFGRSPWSRAVETVLAGGPSADVVATLPGQRRALARALEREGRLAEAVDACASQDSGPEALALHRTGRRLAAALRRTFPPGPQLRPAPVRRLRLPRGTGPLFAVGGTELRVEAAVVAHLDAAGRRAIHGENWLWTSLFALVFRELYWLPVPGMLPTPRRAGPRDLGTPAFYESRRSAAENVLRGVRSGGLERACSGWQGERLAGLITAEVPYAAIPIRMAEVVLGRMLREGWAAARGLPDILVEPGAEISLSDAVPSRLGPGAVLAEVKGPTDALRDEQAWWQDHLLQHDIPVEIWEVRPLSMR